MLDYCFLGSLLYC